MEAAMETVQDQYTFKVRWLPFLLRPEMPPEGVPKPPQYTDPSNPRVQHLINAGISAGIEFTNKSERFPNTLPAHALLEHTLEKYGAEKQDQLMEIIFKAYFTDGVYPNPENLSSMADKVGIDKAEAKAVAGDSSKVASAKDKALDASRRGCTGVPLFYMNGQRLFSGAQESEVFANMFQVVAERFPVAPPAASI